jgi:hypothetical protein
MLPVTLEQPVFAGSGVMEDVRRDAKSKGRGRPGQANCPHACSCRSASGVSVSWAPVVRAMSFRYHLPRQTDWLQASERVDLSWQLQVGVAL